MDEIGAMYETLALARKRSSRLPAEGPASLSHFEDMMSDFSSHSTTKKNRWLGYVQGALVASAAATLEEVMSINAGWKDR